LTALAAGLLAAVAPATPSPRVPPAAGVAGGIGAGAVLYLLALRARPRLPPCAPQRLVFAGKLAVFGLWAACEEVLWRRVVLGELLAGGIVAALALSSIAFALAHAGRRGLHVGTGAAFGGVYLVTGALAASIAAHWTYNVLVAGFVEHSRPT
jgi:membrane protease YdiL (CAAX protease family)